ncbi:MAG: glutathione S-transferase family protein [Pseudomonadota bacterium]
MTLTLWHVRHSRSLRPLWLMLEMGLEPGEDFELVNVPFDRAYFAGPDWAEISPTGKVPVMTDGPARLPESIAMMQYLLATHGPTPLEPKTGDREFADHLFWLHYAEAGVAMYLATYLGHVAGAADYQVGEGHLKNILGQFDRAQHLIAEAVGDRPWLLARGFTAADVAMGYTLHLARLGKLELHEEVAAYRERLVARPAFQRAMSFGGES